MTRLRRLAPSEVTTKLPNTIGVLGPTRGTIATRRYGDTIYVRIGTMEIASAFPLAKLERLGAARARYDAACARAASLYTAEKTDLWRRACDHAKALSRMFPLTVAKKDKDGKYIVPEWDV